MTRNRTLMDHTARPGLLAAFALAIASVGWAYWTTLGDMAQRWAHDPQYSHGYLVPGFALVLLWLRRGMLAEAALQPSWWGAVILGAGIALRLVVAYFHFQWFDALSLLPCLAGVLQMVVGSAAPIALVANVARISATGMVHEVLGDTERGRALANAVFHDFAGWLMMPFALALLGIELKLLRHLLIESHIAGPLALRLVAEPAGRVAVSGGWMDMGLLRRGD